MVGIPLPVRLMPMVRTTLLEVVVLVGSPEMLAPCGTTAPLSRPFGPVPMPGEPGKRLSQSHIICACAQLVKYVSERTGTCLNVGLSVIVLPPHGPREAPC